MQTICALLLDIKCASVDYGRFNCLSDQVCHEDKQYIYSKGVLLAELMYVVPLYPFAEEPCKATAFTCVWPVPHLWTFECWKR